MPDRSWPSLPTGLAGAAVLACLSACAPAINVAPPSPGRLAALEAEVTRSPASADARVQLAAAYRAAGRPDQAVATLEPVASGSRDPAALFLFAISQEEAGRFADARTAYEAYLDAGGPARLNRRARARLALLDRRELEQAVRAAIAREQSFAGTAPEPRSVGVFPFQFAGSEPELAPLGRALAELLSTDLAQTDRLTILERARIQFLLDELQLAQTGLVDSATAARAGRIVQAGRIIQGRIDGDAAALGIQTLVVRVGANRDSVARGLREQAALTALFDVEKRLALSLYQELGVVLTVAERERVLQRPTDNVQALLAFGLGLEADDGARYREAVSRFEVAVSADPDFELARQYLEDARRKAEAEEDDTDELAGLGEFEFGWGLPGWQRRRLPFAWIDPLIPNPQVRDPAPELLGVEGLRRRALITVIVRPPGGN